MKQILCIFLVSISLSTLKAQSISLKVDELKHVYEGGGASIGLYTGHHWSLSNSQRADVYKMLFQDCNMVYVQRYFGPNPYKDNSKYESTIRYVNEARAYKPNIKVSAVMSSVPEEFQTAKTVNGEEKMILDINMPGVYDSLAYWYFDVMQYMHDGNADIDIFNLVNEPDFDKSWLYGYQSNKDGVAHIAQNVIPKLKAILADTTINKDKLVCPKICAPSTLSPYACLTYIKYWKTNYPQAWAQIDIVGLHQYASGSGKQSIYDDIYAELEGRGFIQTEQHTNRGDDIGSPPISDEQRGVISLGQVFTASVYAGVSSWWYFQTNYPQTYHPGGLIRIPWAKEPEYWQTYYAFKQLNGIVPPNANVIERSITSLSDCYVLPFRHIDENKAVVHITNKSGNDKSIKIDAQGEHKQYGIKSIKLWLTDGDSKMENTQNFTFDQSIKEFKITTKPYGITSVLVEYDTTGYEVELKTQTVIFPNIPDQNITGQAISLEAFSTSGLDVGYKIESGSAIISEGNLYALKPGLIRVSASQSGNSEYMPATTVINDFLVYPESENIALGKTATASSLYNTTYTADKAIDGDKESNSSRWLAKNGSELPQWIEIDLGEEHEIEGIGFWVGYDGYNKPFTHFEVQVMKDTMTTVLTVDDNDSPYNIYSFNKITTNKVRLKVNDGASALIRLFELEIYGKALSSGINNQPAKPTVKIYPNPASGNEIKLKGLKATDEVKLFTLSGTEIPCVVNNSTLDISHIRSGVYIIKVNDQASRFIRGE